MAFILKREGADPRVYRLFSRPWYRQCCSSDQRPGCSPPAWSRPWGVSGPGGKTADRTAPSEDTRREVDIYLGGNGTGRCRVLDNGGINQATPEHSCTLYCYTITVRPV